MPLIVDRYLLREILKPWGISIGLFVILAAFGEMLKVSDSVTGFGIGAWDLTMAIVFSLPPLLGLLLPISYLFAVLLALGRWSADGELVAFEAIGYSRYRLYWAPGVCGGVLAIVSMLLLLFGEPWGLKGLQEIASKGAQRALAEGIRPGEFTQWTPQMMFYAEGKEGEIYEQILLSDERRPGEPIAVAAERARVRPGVRKADIFFELQNGMVMSRHPSEDRRRVMTFEKSLYHLDVGRLVRGKLLNIKKIQSFYPSEMQTAIAAEKSAKRRANMIITQDRRIAFALATLIFGLLAVPLGAWSGDASRWHGFLICVVIVVAYYYVGRILELSARAQEIPPWIAVWTPNVAGAMAALSANWWVFRRRR